MIKLIKLVLKKLGYSLPSIHNRDDLVGYVTQIEPQYQPIVLENLKIFLEDQNYLVSLRPFSTPFDVKNPTPWFSFASIEFLNTLESNK